MKKFENFTYNLYLKTLSFKYNTFVFCLFMNNKDKFGEVITPCNFVETMIQDAKYIMGNDFFHLRNHIFETGAGKGVFYETLMKNFDNLSLKYTMNEINDEHHHDLLNLINLYNIDNSHKLILGDLFHIDSTIKYDFVWGNLPFHNGGKSFVPGLAKFNKDNKMITKPEKLVTIWTKMIHFIFQNILQDNGYFFCIIPCIWLKKDKANIYDLFVKTYQICFLKVFDCIEANKIFNYNCQTPICYVMVKKTIQNIKNIDFKLYDNDVNDYIDFHLLQDFCIPTKHASLFKNRLKNLSNKTVSCYDKLKKISTLKKGVVETRTIIFDAKNKDTYMEDYVLNNTHAYKVITGASIEKSTGKLVLHGMISSVCGLYYGIPKLILPHKRLLKCFKDYDGTYSCYGRDMYVFLMEGNGNVNEKIDALESYLMKDENVKLIENGFKIRMQFIEKYVFQYISYDIDIL